MARTPNHPGAHHYYIHAVEASNDPDRALTSADVLGSLMPAAGHMVHMPSHIYLRVGRYADAAEANVRAIAADEDYLAQCQAQGLYPISYYPHNLHFLWAAATLRGPQRRGRRRGAPGRREGAAPSCRRGRLDGGFPGDAVARVRALRPVDRDADSPEPPADTIPTRPASGITAAASRSSRAGSWIAPRPRSRALDVVIGARSVQDEVEGPAAADATCRLRRGS